MFTRLAEQYRSLAQDLVMSLQALASSLQRKGLVATCYVCGDGQERQGASFVADLGDTHTIRFLVSDCGISWVESRNGHELVRLDGADAIQELQRVTAFLQQVPADGNAIKTADHRQAVLISATSQPFEELVG
ncbi:DUF1815 family protein [Synechococcus sp. L2F]|uniref:DUF1815 family protein n=1 Tax=Synechococcus sp. L2F TaxID=2823739 RepID=UPI0020CBB1A9|nr:DUF1815 family protein [Synechococcus sp. L2F]MCP9829606.1 DUF1815 family protein [Synechococcus sp. L2F]